MERSKDEIPSAVMERKLRLQLASKDMKLRQLRDAIKKLEARLIDALKKNADDAMKVCVCLLHVTLIQGPVTNHGGCTETAV